MSRRKSYLLNFLGVLFFSFGVLAIDYAVYRDTPDWALWFCYVSLVLIGVGILVRNANLVASQINLLLIPLIVWWVDFFSRLISGSHLIGTTAYFFTDLIWPARLISLTHFWSLPLAFLALYLLNNKKIGRAWVISMVQASALYFLTLVLTASQWNVNCVFESCFPGVPNGVLFPLYWFVIAFSMIGLTNLLLYWLLVKCLKNDIIKQ